MTGFNLQMNQHFGDGVKSVEFNTFDPVPKVLKSAPNVWSNVRV